MALINTSVPNLIQGVSQQPDATRFDGQCEEQENALSSVAEGLKKRPNTRHIARLLTSAISSNAKVHFINRSDDEKYVAIHDGSLRIFNLDTGVEATITDNRKVDLELGSSWTDYSSPYNTISTFEVFSQQTNPEADYNTVTAINNSLSGKLQLDILEPLSAGDVVSISFNVEELTGSNWELEVRRKNASNTAYDNDTDEAPIAITSTGQQTHSFTITGDVGTGQELVYFYTPDTGTSIKISGIKVTRLDEGTYLSSQVQNPREDLEFLTVADYTFILNKTVTVEELTLTSAPVSPRPYFYIKQGDYSKKYSLTLDGTLAAINSLDDQFASNADTSNIRNRFLTAAGLQLYSGVGYNGLYANAPATSASVADGLGGAGMGMVFKEVPSISDLPSYCVNNHKIKIIGETDLGQDDHYVVFQTHDGNIVSGNGSWVETSGSEISLGVDVATMPQRLINIGLDTFKLEYSIFDKRKAGDDDTNPQPSFVGNTINSVFFFKNRLGFLTSDSVVMSEAGHYYNFYRNTVTTLLDSAPIDVNVASTKVTNLKSAVGFQGNLVLFADNQQFILKGGDILTPKTVSISAATSFDAEESVKPLALGSYIYFPFTRGNYTGAREFSVSNSTENYDAAEITEHVPSYVPKDIIAMA